MLIAPFFIDGLASSCYRPSGEKVASVERVSEENGGE
jgi:hypothetical protein